MEIHIIRNHSPNRNSGNLKMNKYPTVFVVTITSNIFFCLQEIIFIRIKNRRHFLFLETWLKFGAVALALVLPQMVYHDPKNGEDWARLIATVALLLSWFEMMFLLSRFPDWGFYVLMFGKVASKVFKVKYNILF